MSGRVKSFTDPYGDVKADALVKTLADTVAEDKSARFGDTLGGLNATHLSTPWVTPSHKCTPRHIARGNRLGDVEV